MSVFRHDIKKAWDISNHNTEENGTEGKKKRTVMYEAISVSVIKADPDQKEVEVAEFNIIELEEMGDGFMGLCVVEARTFMDASPVMKRMGEIRK